MGKSSSFIPVVMIFWAMALQASSLIFNGHTLEDSQIPQMQGLWRKGSLTCSATLIGPNVIITAAHCTSATAFGENATKSIKVKFISHPKYRKKALKKDGLEGLYDVAIGILEERIDSITPISVTSKIPSVGAYILFAGAGVPRPTTRQYGYVEVFKRSTMGVTSRGIKSNRQVAGSGDSGGPTFYSHKDGTIELFAVNSTSTQKTDHTKQFGEFGKPFTMGSALVFPKEPRGSESFILKLVKDKKLDICGINLNCPPVSLR